MYEHINTYYIYIMCIKIKSQKNKMCWIKYQIKNNFIPHKIKVVFHNLIECPSHTAVCEMQPK